MTYFLSSQRKQFTSGVLAQLRLRGRYYQEYKMIVLKRSLDQNG